MNAASDNPGVFPATRRAVSPAWSLASLLPAAFRAARVSVQRATQAAWGLVLPALVYALWWSAAHYRWVPEQLLPAPALVWQSLHELWRSGELQSHLAFSASRVAWGLLIGGAAGSLLGLVMGLSGTLRAYLHPSFSMVAQFPVLGWVPLLIIFVGIDEALKISAISIAVTVPVTLNTLRGVAQVPVPLLDVARVFRFTRTQVLWRVMLPAAAPNLFTGLRQAVMQGWLSLVFVELLASSEGIGYLIVWGRQLSQPDLVIAGMVVIGVVGVLLDLALRRLEAQLQGWRRGAF